MNLHNGKYDNHGGCSVIRGREETCGQVVVVAAAVELDNLEKCSTKEDKIRIPTQQGFSKDTNIFARITRGCTSSRKLVNASNPC